MILEYFLFVIKNDLFQKMHLTINLLSAKELEEDFKKLEAEKVKLLEDEKNLRKEVDAQILLFECEVAAIRKNVENLKQISLLI